VELPIQRAISADQADHPERLQGLAIITRLAGARPIAKRTAGPLTFFPSQKSCALHHRLPTRPMWQWFWPAKPRQPVLF